MIVVVWFVGFLLKLEFMRRLHTSPAILVAAAAQRHHAVRFLPRFDVFGNSGWWVFANSQRAQDHPIVQLYSSLDMFSAALFDLRFLVRVLLLFRLYNGGYGCGKFRVIDGGLGDVSNYFRCIYQLLDRFLDQRLQSGPQTASDCFVLFRDGPEQQFGHLVFNVTLDAGSSYARNDHITRGGLKRTLLNSIWLFSETTVS